MISCAGLTIPLLQLVILTGGLAESPYFRSLVEARLKENGKSSGSMVMLANHSTYVTIIKQYTLVIYTNKCRLLQIKGCVNWSDATCSGRNSKTEFDAQDFIYTQMYSSYQNDAESPSLDKIEPTTEQGPGKRAISNYSPNYNN